MASVTAFLSYCNSLIRNAPENQEVVLKPNFPELIRKSCNEVERMFQAETSPVNKWQCRHLQERLNDIKGLGPEKVESGGSELFKELYRIVKEAEDLIRRCCSQPWMRTAITQADNGEHFCELLHDLDWCIITIRKQASSTGNLKRSLPRRGTKFKLQLAKSIAQNRSKNAEAARKDREELEVRLQEAIQKGEDLQLANYLLSRLTNSNSSLDAERERKTLLGSGAYGVVYETSWLGGIYAEKVFNFAGENSKLLKKSFERESRALKSLRHRNVVQLVNHYCNDENGSFLMTKEDMDLLKLISKKGSPPFSLEVTLDILLQIARGLQYMHRLKMAHRDIKAGNILVSLEKYSSIFEAEGYVHVKLADFGMAKVKREPGCVQSTNSITFGNKIATLLWRAPELFNESNVVDYFAADIYSYGIMCSEILTGQLPFSNADETVSPEDKDFYTRIAVDGDRPLLPTREDVCPRALAFLVSMCWSTDPANRPSAAQIVRYLQDFKASLLVQAPFDHISWTWKFDPENVNDDDVSSSDDEPPQPPAPPPVAPARVETDERGTSPVPPLFERAKSFVPWLRRGMSTVEVPSKETVTVDELEITSIEWETKRFPFKKLQAATNNFNVPLGAGPYAKIFRGKFSGKVKEAAVRHLNFASKADPKTFLENVAVMATLKHDGLINLVGYCENEGEFYLVHEFIETPGTIGTVFLRYARSKEHLVNRDVPWSQRGWIAVRVCEALAFLHDKDIVHGELTNRTIMLEEPNLNPRLFDFGMSFLFPKSTRKSTFHSIDDELVQWLAPELKDAVNNEVRRKTSIKPSRESDMYNFGVLLLVLMGKRRVVENPDPEKPAFPKKSKYIINEACDFYEEGDVMNFLHEATIEEGSMTSESVMLSMHVALLCLQKDAWRRPTASEAVRMLQGEVAIPAEQLLNITARIQRVKE